VIVTALFENIHENLFTSLVLVNLRKAFDTVHHKTLLDKLEYCGIRRVAHDLINSYFSHCKQFALLNQNRSEVKSPVFPNIR